MAYKNKKKQKQHVKDIHQIQRSLKSARKKAKLQKLIDGPVYKRNKQEIDRLLQKI